MRSIAQWAGFGLFFAPSSTVVVRSGEVAATLEMDLEAKAAPLRQEYCIEVSDVEYRRRNRGGTGVRCLNGAFFDIRRVGGEKDIPVWGRE